jgi:hypothetical protein
LCYYSQEKLLDIRTAVTHQHYQHYDQEYDFPESDPLFLPPRAIELISEADKKTPPAEERSLEWTSSPTQEVRTPPILLTKVQSLDNKVYELKARNSFQRDFRDSNILCFTGTWLSV